MKAESPTLITAYENEIKRLEETKIVLSEKVAQTALPRADLSETYQTAMAFLANPLKLRQSEALETKRMLLRLAFPERVSDCWRTGYRTAPKAEPFRLLEGLRPLSMV